jgi:biopolymer transport protein ExbD
MSMNVGSSSASGEPEVMMDINTTPLIDVMLVLLVMLIITIPIQLHAVNLNMPAGNPPPPPTPPEVVQLDIDFDGTVVWNGEVQPTRVAMESKMAAAVAQPIQPEVHIRPNKLVAYRSVAAVMASAQRLGLQKIGIVGNEQFVN